MQPCSRSSPTCLLLISNCCGRALRTSGGHHQNTRLKRASATITLVLIGHVPCAQPALQPAIPTRAGDDLHRRRGYTGEVKALSSIWSTPSMMIGARHRCRRENDVPLLWEQNLCDPSLHGALA